MNPDWSFTKEAKRLTFLLNENLILLFKLQIWEGENSYWNQLSGSLFFRKGSFKLAEKWSGSSYLKIVDTRKRTSLDRKWREYQLIRSLGKGYLESRAKMNENGLTNEIVIESPQSHSIFEIKLAYQRWLKETTKSWTIPTQQTQDAMHSFFFLRTRRTVKTITWT